MQKVLINIGGQYGRLTALERVENDKFRRTQYACRCSCGKEIIVAATCLKTGNTRSCGCLHKEGLIRRNYKHGMSKTYENRSFSRAKGRCENINVKRYKDYGGRGIKFKFKNFEEFFSHVGKAPSSIHSIDRIDNNGHYEVGNVRWATPKEQANNRRKANVDRKGSKNNASHLTNDDVLKIREYYKVSGRGSGVYLSKKYGISTGNISLIVNRVTWSHI